MSLRRSRLLKGRHQPARRSRSWRAAITAQRGEIPLHLRDNAGLAARVPGIAADAYRLARRQAAAETGLTLAAFPEDCAFTVEEALSDDVWPAAIGRAAGQGGGESST